MKRLADDDLNMVTGGATSDTKQESGESKRISCPDCFEVFKVNPYAKTAKCPSCGKIIEIKG